MVTVGRLACLKVTPQILYVLWCIIFVALGGYVMIRDASFRTQPCGQSTHLWKYTLLNTVFCFFTCSTFFLFPGGGEGARARAMVITIFHLAFGVWGILMWERVSNTCMEVLRDQYETMYAFHHMSVIHNMFLFVFLLVHEAYLGQKLGFDYTLMSEIHPGPSPAYYNANAGNGQPGVGVGSMMPGSPPPGSTPPQDMGPINTDIKEAYDNIIKSPPGHLPQGQP
jgi:hypothetical protein